MDLVNRPKQKQGLDHGRPAGPRHALNLRNAMPRRKAGGLGPGSFTGAHGVGLRDKQRYHDNPWQVHRQQSRDSDSQGNKVCERHRGFVVFRRGEWSVHSWDFQKPPGEEQRSYEAWN